MTREFTSSRGRTVLLAVLAAMMGFGAWILPESSEHLLRWQIAHWLGGPFFSVAAVLLAVQVLFPVNLKLDADGFSCAGGLGRGYRVAWRDVDSFGLWTRVGRFSDKPIPQGVEWTYRPGVKPGSLLIGLTIGMGAKPVLPPLLKIEPEALLAVMNQALEASRK